MTTRTEKLEMRLSTEAKTLLRTAAELKHKTMSEFVLDSAISRAEETILDQRVFRLSAEEWTAFQEALDRAPTRHERMEKLLNTPTVFD